jgi:hypothetical protein
MCQLEAGELWSIINMVIGVCGEIPCFAIEESPSENFRLDSGLWTRCGQATASRFLVGFLTPQGTTPVDESMAGLPSRWALVSARAYLKYLVYGVVSIHCMPYPVSLSKKTS